MSSNLQTIMKNLPKSEEEAAAKEGFSVIQVQVGMFVKPQFLRDEQLTGSHIGIFPVKNRLSSLEIQNELDAVYFGDLLRKFWETDE